MSALFVFLGGGLGAVLRYLVGLAATPLLGTGFPWGTLIVNVVGGLAMGLLATWLAPRGADAHELRLFLTTGLLGGFTTFSTFSLEAFVLWESGETFAAMLYVTLSIVFALGGLALGVLVMRGIAS